MKKEEKRGLMLVAVVATAFIVVALVCGSLFSGSGGGGNDLSSAKWDKYYGCLSIQQDWGNSRVEAREICGQYRP